VEELNRAELKSNEGCSDLNNHNDNKPEGKQSRKPVQPPTDVKQWLQKYISNSSSGAKLVTALLTEGCTIEEASTKALEFAKQQGKGSKWGTTSHVKAHWIFETEGMQS